MDRGGWRGRSASGLAVLVVVDDEDAGGRALTREVESRYGAHYEVVSSASPAAALARLEELKAEGADVPLILADQWMPGMTGTEFLARAKNVVLTTRRALLISWGDRFGRGADFGGGSAGAAGVYLPKPAWSPDEQFHRATRRRASILYSA